MGTANYSEAGVKDQKDALSAVARHLRSTFALPRDAEVLTDFGDYASVLKVSPDLAIAVATDSAGSKTMIASALDRYDTIGFDCMAMNVNDVLCVGARPIALVDYIGVHTLDDRRTDEILRGLAAAAREAGVAIPGGEVAQLPDLIGSDGTSGGDESAFDLVGTAVGVLHPDALVLGQRVAPGHAIVGVASSGIHSNGLTLARKVLLRDAGYELSETIPALGRSLGEELLEPTLIYVSAVRAIWDAGVATHGLVHITGDGLANLCRLQADVTYRVDALPARPAIFDLIQRAGGVAEEEMYRVYNMGIGFVLITPDDQADDAVAAAAATGLRALKLGRVDEGPREVRVEPAGLVGRLENGASSFSRS